MRRADQFLPIEIFTLLLTVTILFTTASLSWSAEKVSDSAHSDINTEQMIAELSDEQVRQLLIDELKKDAAVEEPTLEQMKGPALFLSRLLGGLSGEHDDNKDQVKELLAAFPNMGPDLYKVFIKL